MTPPKRHWRTYGNDPLPSGIEARDEPFAAFPSWFLRIECDRCGKVQMINEVHFARPNMPVRAILAKMRHDGCGGRAGKAELLTGIEGVSSRRCAGSCCRRDDSSLRLRHRAKKELGTKQFPRLYDAIVTICFANCARGLSPHLTLPPRFMLPDANWRGRRVKT
jgi:ribosomal protein S27E